MNLGWLNHKQMIDMEPLMDLERLLVATQTINLVSLSRRLMSLCTSRVLRLASKQRHGGAIPPSGSEGEKQTGLLFREGGRETSGGDRRRQDIRRKTIRRKDSRKIFSEKQENGQ